MAAEPERGKIASLLAWLGAGDQETGVTVYMRLRRVLTAFFDNRGHGADADVLVDLTFDRIVAKDFPAATSPPAYVHGVARFIALEHNRTRMKFEALETEPAAPVASADDAQDVERRRCLAKSLAGLSAQDYRLLREYYSADTRKAASRRSLSQETRLSAGAIRVRVSRLRSRLREEIESCLALRRAGANPLGAEDIV